MTHDGRRQIKRYGNRKHYDVHDARYVSMLDLSEIVARGNELLVIDDRTGRDITLQTLARALYERLKRREGSSSTVRLDPIIKFDLARIISQVPFHK